MKIKPFNFAGGGVNTSSRATFGLKAQDVIASVSEAIQKLFTQLSHKPQCHSELGSESHVAKIPCQARDDKRGILPLCKALAFTLAETLIVMGIIGVVAALTIPNLNSSTADKEKVAKVKKLYSNLNEALGRAIAVYGPIDEWYSGKTSEACKQVFYERITEFMKVTKTCAPNTSGCWKNFDGSSTSKWYTVITADGSSVFFGSWSSCSNTDGANENCAKIYVDIDGPQKGNSKMGKDQFRFSATRTGLEYDNTIEYKSEANQLINCLKNGYDCERWIIQNGNMDYLKADASGKCPNGKILNWETQTSCK